MTTDAISAKQIPSTPRWSATAGVSGAKPTPTIRRITRRNHPEPGAGVSTGGCAVSRLGAEFPVSSSLTTSAGYN